jgi:pilus assembly protein Flp/PilA
MLKHYIALISFLETRRKDEEGASAVEYGLLVAAIAAAIVLIVFLLGDVITEVFTTTCNTIDTETGTGVGC